MSTTNLAATCYGTNCHVRPTWKLRVTTEGVWLGACGRHLAWVATDLTGGEHGVLDLVRIRCDER